MIEDIHGGQLGGQLGDHWRLVQCRHHGNGAIIGVGWRVVAWENRAGSGTVRAFHVERDRGSKRVFFLDPAKLDLAPHVAFCRGAMPPEVYADWLQENAVDLPPEAYALLRHAAYTAATPEG